MDKIIKDILSGQQLSYDRLMKLWDVEINDLIRVSDDIRQHFHGNSFDMCTIVNGKSGKCSEDCSYCAQSSHFPTNVESYPLKSYKDIIEDAKRNEEAGILRYSIVTSGKRASKEEVDQLLNIYQQLGETTNLKLCSSHGLLDYDALKALKEAGVKRYHNNLETSRSYFPNICTTHSYDEKIKTIQDAMRAGLEVCSGGIIGLGESREDRVEMALTLRNLGIMSIPLNVLSPIPNTPLAKIGQISEEEFIRTCAIFRLANPEAVIRLAGGRSLLEGFGYYAFKSGVNGTISGELLTTYGNSTSDDIRMIRELGFKIY